MSNYTDLDIYKTAYRLAIKVHHLRLTLPKHELYEQGSQVRRSSKSIKDTIAEGYGRKRHKADFIKFFRFAQASCDETLSQLTMINELINEYYILGSKINRYIQYVESKWKT